jgi:hypothetical protein
LSAEPVLLSATLDTVAGELTTVWDRAVNYTGVGGSGLGIAAFDSTNAEWEDNGGVTADGGTTSIVTMEVTGASGPDPALLDIPAGVFESMSSVGNLVVTGFPLTVVP